MGVGNHDNTVDAAIDLVVTSAAALGDGPGSGHPCTCGGCDDLNLPAAGDNIDDVRAGEFNGWWTSR
jgi:hypothetical protein